MTLSSELNRIIWIIIIIILNVTSSKTQDIEIIPNSNLDSIINPTQKFNRISSNIDQSKLLKVADINYEASIGEYSNFFDQYLAVKKEVRKIGGNGYLIDTISINDETLNISLDIFHISDSLYFDYIDTLELRNSIVVFGSIYHKDYPRKLKFNGKKYKLNPFEYMIFTPEINEFNQVSIGGFTGSRISFYWEDGEPSRYYCTTGFNGSPDLSTGFGVQFNNGKFNSIKRETAIFLSNFMELNE